MVRAEVEAAAMALFRRNPLREAATRAYGLVVEHARRPAFFTDFEVPDTIDGRFELICLHAFLYLHRLKTEGDPGASLAQFFFDLMFADFDRSLRELGTGDLSVGREVKQMAQAFYGRIHAYEHGLDAAGDAQLDAALRRNLYGTAAPGEAALAAMAAYLRAEAAQLARQDAAALFAGTVSFGFPQR
jgi:cytochrome b pre-mRNA-processing protein 3